MIVNSPVSECPDTRSSSPAEVAEPWYPLTKLVVWSATSSTKASLSPATTSPYRRSTVKLSRSSAR